MKQRGQNWTPIYLIIVLIIAAVLILTFKRTLGVSQAAADSTRSIAKNALDLFVFSRI